MICLPKELSQKFIQALKDKVITPDKLSQMSSEERRSLLEDIVGKDQAKDVNALFESKLLLKDQQTGIMNWAKEIAGKSPEIQRDIIARVNKMETVLNPKDLKSFLADLAAKKVGAEVTPEEAQKISELAKQAQENRAARDANPSNENILKYGKSKGAFGEYLNSIKPDGDKGFLKTVANIANIPKSLLTSLPHFSAPFVQGWGMMSTPEFWKGTVQMFKYFASEENYKNAEAMISGHPDYDLAKKSGLGLTSIDGKLNDREEAIQSSLVQRGAAFLAEKTHTPDVIRGFSRAFTGFLNYVRFNRFEDLLTSARLKGEDVNKGSKLANDLARVVNNFTGRGDLGRLNTMTPELNSVFFSPRKIAATIEMFNPREYYKLDSTARMAALRQLSGSLIITASVLGLARLSGASVNWNPISSNFGKVKLGNTTLDMTGGNAAYVKLLSQIASGKEQTSSGQTQKLGGIIQTKSKSGKTVNTPFTAPTGINQIESYVRDHLSPVASLVWDWQSNWTNAVGQPVNPKSELYNAATPLVLQDWINLAKNDPKNAPAWIASLAAVFGVSMQSNAPITKNK